MLESYLKPSMCDPTISDNVVFNTAAIKNAPNSSCKTVLKLSALSYNQRLAFTICYSIMTCFGGVANVLSIVCLRMKYKSKRNRMDKLLLSLASCDTLVSFTVYPVHAWINYWENIPFDSKYTRLRAFWTLSMCLISTNTIILLAVVRYFSLKRIDTFNMWFIKRYRMNVTIVLSWVLPFGIMSPYLITQRYRISLINFAFVSLTLVLLPTFYLLIIANYQKSRRRMSTLQSKAPKRDQITIRTTTRLVRRSLWLIGVYFLSTILAIPAMYIYQTKDIVSGVWFHLTNLLYLANSCGNPCIYYYTDGRIRRIAKNLFMRNSRDQKI